jgi:hypothetical protein
VTDGPHETTVASPAPAENKFSAAAPAEAGPAAELADEPVENPIAEAAREEMDLAAGVEVGIVATDGDLLVDDDLAEHEALVNSSPPAPETAGSPLASPVAASAEPDPALAEAEDRPDFESRLGPNTVTFAAGRVLVREGDSAVQIDIRRFNPDQGSLIVRYRLRDVTATEGEDYIAPGEPAVLFGRGQDTARILIPLVQDSTTESDESFVLEMPELPSEQDNANIFRRIAVMIRDDD